MQTRDHPGKPFNDCPAETRPCTLALDITMPMDVATGAVVQMQFTDLDHAMLDRLSPTRVILPLLGRCHDAVQVIERLQTLGYKGELTVVAPTLPDPSLVERELRGLGPGLRLRLLMR